MVWIAPKEVDRMMGKLDKRGGSLQRSETSQMMGNGSPCFGEETPLTTNPFFLALDLGLTHFLASVLAGLLRGQLSDQQWLQELAHEIQVAVEGTEGILGSRWEVVSQGHGLQPASWPREGRAHQQNLCGPHTSGPEMLSQASSRTDPSVPGSHSAASGVRAPTRGCVRARSDVLGKSENYPSLGRCTAWAVGGAGPRKYTVLHGLLCWVSGSSQSAPPTT